MFRFLHTDSTGMNMDWLNTTDLLASDPAGYSRISAAGNCFVQKELSLTTYPQTP